MVSKFKADKAIATKYNIYLMLFQITMNYKMR